MTDYSEFDAALIARIDGGANQFYLICCNKLLTMATRLSPGSRDDWRVIDRRLQALRKAGKLTYDRKNGWRVS